MSPSARPTRSPLYDPNAWLHYAEALEAELERATELAERYGGAIIAISKALTADDLNPAGRIMRARGFVAGLAEAEPDNA